MQTREGYRRCKSESGEAVVVMMAIGSRYVRVISVFKNLAGLTIALVVRGFLFELLLEGFGSHENILRSFPALSKYAIPLFWLRPNQQFKHWQFFSIHPVDAVHRT